MEQFWIKMDSGMFSRSFCILFYPKIIKIYPNKFFRHEKLEVFFNVCGGTQKIATYWFFLSIGLIYLSYLTYIMSTESVILPHRGREPLKNHHKKHQKRVFFALSWFMDLVLEWNQEKISLKMHIFVEIRYMNHGLNIEKDENIKILRPGSF